MNDLSKLIKDYYLGSNKNENNIPYYSSKKINKLELNELELNKHNMTEEIDLSKTSLIIPVCKFVPSFIQETILNLKLSKIFINALINKN